jgi:hypothetical protein
VPLALYTVDEHRGTVDLVLSRADGESLLASLVEALGVRGVLPGHAHQPLEG